MVCINWKNGASRAGAAIFASLALMAAGAFSPSAWAFGGCANDCIGGDVAEGEACLVSNAGRTNDGCNMDIAAYEDVTLIIDIDGNGAITVCGNASTFNEDAVDTRDTDWIRVSQAQLLAVDGNNDGIVEIRSTLVAEPPSATFFIGIEDCENLTFPGGLGFSDPSCAGGETANAILTIADHTAGIVVFVGTAQSNGTPIFTGFPCNAGQNDYSVTIEVVDIFAACLAKDAGPCNDENNPTPGCDDVLCCQAVCELDDNCCFGPWDDVCVAIAVDDLMCTVGLGAPSKLATGDNSGVDGFLSILAGGMGSMVIGSQFGGGPDWIDRYNPVGAQGPHTPVFTYTTFLYTDTDAISLSLHDDSNGLWGFEGDLGADISGPNVVTDESGDGVDDQQVSTFTVDGALELDVILTQRVESLEPEVPGGIFTQTYEITNTGAAVSFRFVRWMDVDGGGAAGFGNDVVGTGTNAGVNCDRFVYMTEEGDDANSITLSIDQPGAAYVGSKNTVNADPKDPNCPAFGFGTDLQVWNNFGFPDCFVNHIANVGDDTDGESGTEPGSDGSMGVQSTIELGVGESITIVLRTTYGAKTPSNEVCDGGGVVHADAFNAFRGFLDSGTLADTLTSDDVDLCHDLGITIFPAEAPITLDFDGQLPTDSPATLDVTFESSANTPGLGLTILMWNYNTNSWEEIGTAAQGFNVDTVRTFAATPADHVEPGTGNVRTRYEVRQTGIIFAFPWTDCIDEMFWTHG